MGSGASALVAETPGTDLRLPAAGLRFTAQEVRSLNSYVDTLHEEDQNGRMSSETECAVESLVQRIVDGAGQRDPRFKCCHLVALHREKKMRSRSLEYLVTLDSLPVLNDGEDCRLVEGPVGYGKIRLGGREADKWADFITPAGYLCRDKVVERWVELIARCAQSKGGGASRALSASVLPRARPYTYCYLERASHLAALERRLAIVEGCAWVMVRVGAGEAEAKLVLAVRAAGCSAHAYTTRVPLTHPLALLHYTCAQGGYYAVAVGPPSSTANAERASIWQLWHPALEATLDAHTSHLSSMAKISGALNSLVDKMREGCFQGSAALLSRYAAWCAYRRRLDRCALYRSAAARAAVSAHAAHHLLLILDNLLHVCERGGVAGYVYPTERSSLVRRGARDTDWSQDAAAVRNCLLYLHRIAVGEDIPQSPAEKLEAALISRWEGVCGPSGGGVTSYSRHQLVYLNRLVRELIACKNFVTYDQHSNFRANLIQATSQHHESIEELIHILAILLDQARDIYFTLHTRSHAVVGEFDRELAVYRSKKWNKLRDYYDASSACLIDAVRRDPDLRREDLSDELTVMKNVLHWLYKGAKEDKKYLGPVLKPFLGDLHMTAAENSWFLEDFEAKKCAREFEGLKDYCLGVHEGLEPCVGLLDAAKKFTWAKALVDLVDRYRHFEFRLVFPTGDGLAVSYPVKLPSRREHRSARVLTLSRRDKAEAKLRLARRCVLAAFTSVLVGRPHSKQISRHGSTEEILASVQNGSYWRNTTKPDIIPSNQDPVSDLPKVRRRSRRRRPATSYGFPEISITSQSDTKTLRRKYHTLKSLVYTEPVESIRELRERPRSAGSTVRDKAITRPSILETLDFINGVKDALCVEESGTSDAEDGAWSVQDEWVIGQAAPLTLIASRCGGALHLTLGDLLHALLLRGKFTILQELCAWLGESSEGALFALHRLSRACRARSTERSTDTWKLPETDATEQEPPQRYRPKPPDYMSGDEAPQPPPLPRRSSRDKKLNRYPEISPPIQKVEHQMRQLQLVPPRLTQNPPNPLNPTQTQYTGIINPIYDIKIPRDKFTVKRTKSLGRTFSTRNLGLEITRYNLTLGHRNGKRTNDVVTAIKDTTTETGLDVKSNFFQRYSTSNVVGDSYRISRITID
ncbi:uncharacterized protein LOC112046458 isoform X2 [Bicyclus anynana]|uniref:Uncharacterized protein LOC112046458 isoform X2 n=1 Tax=Bicyclus anynana TaxID=110368 RepID=A0A6J1MWA5_BICAN|nr:uncharacterized protein LOC112046458 isoform X2 [Bicyclus anynana]